MARRTTEPSTTGMSIGSGIVGRVKSITGPGIESTIVELLNNFVCYVESFRCLVVFASMLSSFISYSVF